MPSDFDDTGSNQVAFPAKVERQIGYRSLDPKKLLEFHLLQALHSTYSIHHPGRYRRLQE